MCSPELTSARKTIRRCIRQHPLGEMPARRSKSALSRLGFFVPPKAIGQLNSVRNYLALGRWMKENDFVALPRVSAYERVFDRIAQDVSTKRVLYLEFSVFEGASMRY